jgi:hypothetical protein
LFHGALLVVRDPLAARHNCGQRCAFESIVTFNPVTGLEIRIALQAVF